jgi:hypothetical protein
VSNLNTDQIEATYHPFIIRIWLEETVEEAGRAKWRGHITHVPSGKRRYVDDLNQIAEFIAGYLQGMGVQPRRKWQVIDRFGRLRAWFTNE